MYMYIYIYIYLFSSTALLIIFCSVVVTLMHYEFGSVWIGTDRRNPKYWETDLYQ